MESFHRRQYLSWDSQQRHICSRRRSQVNLEAKVWRLGSASHRRTSQTWVCWKQAQCQEVQKHKAGRLDASHCEWPWMLLRGLWAWFCEHWRPSGVESQSLGLSYILIANSLMSRGVYTADGIDEEGSMFRRDQRTSRDGQWWNHWWLIPQL